MRLVTISMSASTRSSSNERRSAAGSVPSKAATTNTRQPASRIMAIRAALPSCVRLRPGVSTSSIAAMRDLLRMVDLAELLDARVGDRGHRALAGVGQRRIGRHARQPMEQRALARALIADQSDFHDTFLS